MRSEMVRRRAVNPSLTTDALSTHEMVVTNERELYSETLTSSMANANAMTGLRAQKHPVSFNRDDRETTL